MSRALCAGTPGGRRCALGAHHGQFHDDRGRGARAGRQGGGTRDSQGGEGSRRHLRRQAAGDPDRARPSRGDARDGPWRLALAPLRGQRRRRDHTRPAARGPAPPRHRPPRARRLPAPRSGRGDPCLRPGRLPQRADLARPQARRRAQRGAPHRRGVRRPRSRAGALRGRPRHARHQRQRPLAQPARHRRRAPDHRRPRLRGRHRRLAVQAARRARRPERAGRRRGHEAQRGAARGGKRHRRGAISGTRRRAARSSCRRRGYSPRRCRRSSCR